MNKGGSSRARNDTFWPLPSVAGYWAVISYCALWIVAVVATAGVFALLFMHRKKTISLYALHTIVLVVIGIISATWVAWLVALL